MSYYVKPGMSERLSGCQLVEVTAPTVALRHFLLRRKDSMDINLLFLPNLVVIASTSTLLSDGENLALCSIDGVDLHRFCTLRSEEHLCRSFLQKKWRTLAAIRFLTNLRESLENDRDGRDDDDDEGFAYGDQLDALQDNDLTEVCDNEAMFDEFISDHDLEDFVESGASGVDFDEYQAGWLCVIHRRFLSLVQALPSSPALPQSWEQPAVEVPAVAKEVTNSSGTPVSYYLGRNPTQELIDTLTLDLRDK